MLVDEVFTDEDLLKMSDVFLSRKIWDNRWTDDDIITIVLLTIIFLHI